MSALLKTTDLAVHFGGVKAVDGVSVEIKEGLIYGLIGPNGSGKSTMLGAISRLTTMTGGSVHFDGHDYTNDLAESVARRGLARTFQTVRLIPKLSVVENVMLGGDVAAFGRSAWRPWALLRWAREREQSVHAAALEALEGVGLSGYADRMPDTLSYGAQRRVEIARAVISRPRLLLLDEPTAGMTHEERSDIAALLKRMRGEGLTQVLVDHDVAMVVDVSDHVFVLSNGRLIASGPPDDVVRDPLVQEAYLGRSGGHGAA